MLKYIREYCGREAQSLTAQSIVEWKKSGSEIMSPPGRPANHEFNKRWMNFAYKLKPDGKEKLRMESAPQSVDVFRAYGLRLQNFAATDKSRRLNGDMNLGMTLYDHDKNDVFEFDWMDYCNHPKTKPIEKHTHVPDTTPSFGSQAEDERVMAHSLSRSTCYRTLHKHSVNFRGITTIDKKVPTEDVVVNFQRQTRKILDDSSVYRSDRFILFLDETATKHESKKRLPVPNGIKSIPGSAINEKTGFTSVTICTRDGLCLGPNIILKCSIKDEFDLTTSRVLKTLHKEHFTAPTWYYGDDFECIIDGQTYKRPYLINIEDGTLYTVQNEGYMDRAGMMLLAQKLLSRFYPGEKKALIMDNFSAHVDDEVLVQLKKINIDTILLPPNTTPILCVPDTHYHKPLKSFLASERALEVMEQNLEWQRKRSEIVKMSGDWDDAPLFIPKAETNIKLIQSCTTFYLEKANEDEFRAGARRAWINAGLLAQEDGTYIEYDSKEKKIDTSIHPTDWYDEKLQLELYQTSREKSHGKYLVRMRNKAI